MENGSLTSTIPSALLNSKRILERLRTDSNKQRRDSLNRLEATCDALDRSKGDLSFANIGRTCFTEFGKGPREQALKNDPGFKEYVRARRDERLLAAEAEPKPGKRRNVSRTEALIEKIADPSLRTRMRKVYADEVEFRRRLMDIQAALLLLTPGLDVDTIVRRYKANPGAPISMAPPSSNANVPPESVEALRALLGLFDKAEHLGRFGLQSDGKRITRAKGVPDEFVGAKLLAALRRLHTTLADRPEPTAIDVGADEAPD